MTCSTIWIVTAIFGRIDEISQLNLVRRVLTHSQIRRHDESYDRNHWKVQRYTQRPS